MEQTIEQLARKRFPDPMTGSIKDPEDFNYRKSKAAFQRQAYKQGLMDSQKVLQHILHAPQPER